MKLDTAGFTDKDSKKPEYRQLYEDLPFIEAYAKHTDMRIAKDGPELAIGAKRDGQQDWDKHGKLQLDFLIARGLMPDSSLLDFGCGTGRLAQQAIPYLINNGYTGIDISEKAIDHCRHTLIPTTFNGHYPMFLKGDGTLKAVIEKGFTFVDFIFSHSVITHLPPEAVRQLFDDLSEWQFGQFFFTYKQGDNKRTGLKQFCYRPDWFVKAAAIYGLKAETDPMEWPAGQKTMRVTRA